MDFVYDHSGIGRVVSAVRDAGGDVPAEFYSSDPRTVRRARLNLGMSISGAFAWARSHADLTNDRRAEKRFAAMGKAAKHAQGLISIVEAERSLIEDAFSRHIALGDDAPELSDIFRALQLLTTALDAERTRLEGSELHNRAPLNLIFSPAEAGDDTAASTESDALMVALKRVFRQFFGEPTMPQPIVGKPEGPFLAFVMTVREEAGSPVQPDSIRRAWYRARPIQDED